jgi:hypothetical protein
MPSPDFSIKVGDTASRLQATLEDSTGAAVSIQSATVLLKLGAISVAGTALLSGTVTNDQVGDGSDGSKGKVHYSWGTADTTNLGPGWFTGEWEVTYSSGTVQTFPNDGYFLVAITNDL